MYIDVQELSGELPETEKETKAKKETEAEKDSDYILPESNSRYLTDGRRRRTQSERNQLCEE